MAQAVLSIPFREVDFWVEQSLAEKYAKGLCRIARGFQPVLFTLASIESNLLSIGGFLCALQSGNATTQLPESRHSATNIDICKCTIDKLLQSLDFVSEFPGYADHKSFCRVARLCKEFKDNLTGGLRTIHSCHIQSLDQSCNNAIQLIATFTPKLASTISDYESVLEESRPFTEHLGAIKEKILGSNFPSLISDQNSVLEARQTARACIAVRSKYDIAKQYAEAVCTDPRLKEGRQLQAERDELAAGMDAVLSPFVRISQNLQGKGGTLVAGGDLTPDEAACVRKYTGILVRPDLYELLEEEGSIENLLEALFLLGIASGVGTDQAPAAAVPAVPSAVNAQAPSRPPPPAGLSRKSQALLTDALNKFQADRLRCSHADWLDRRRRLADLERCPEYQSCRAAAEAAAAALLDEARALDAATRRARDAEERGQRAAAALTEFQDHLQVRVFEELDKLAHVNVDLDETLNQFRDSEISNGSFSA